jgi:cyclohexadieny/prephenate dehydrogenase
MNWPARVAIVGLGLIGSSVALGTRRALPDAAVTGFDGNAGVRATARAIGLCDVADTLAEAVAGADLIVLAVPVGAMGAVAGAMAAHLLPDAIVTDVGSCKEQVAQALRAALPDPTRIVPAHPVAGTEQSGPEAGFASLFKGRWCILTPDAEADPQAVERVAGYWRALGAEVETMDAAHHDRVLAVTSHLPHLIAYTIVGTASDLEEVTQSEVIKYSAGGFRDFTRIAASDPVMWRDVFLANREAVLDMLQRFSEDLTALQRAIRWGRGDELHDLFTRTRAVRRSIVEQGQDDAAPDFGRAHE